MMKNDALDVNVLRQPRPLPVRMMAMLAHGFGAADVLTFEEAPLPLFGPEDVLIEVCASGVNRPDILQRQGLYPPPKNASPILGLEVSGWIAACGSSVTRWRVGEPVCALVNGGGYAQYVAAPNGQCMSIPSNVSVQDAAGLPEVYMTVWSNLIDRCHLQAGERLLVHGGTSGIGCAAIQVAKLIGVEVAVTVGSEAKRQAALALGADRAYLYTDNDWSDAVLEWTGDQGVDVILDMVAGPYIEKNIHCLADDGRLSIIALLGGKIAVLDCAQLLMRRITLTGSTLRPRQAVFKAALAASLTEHVWPHFETHRIKPMVSARFLLSEAASAHRMMEAGQNIGKIILTVND